MSAGLTTNDTELSRLTMTLAFAHINCNSMNNHIAKNEIAVTTCTSIYIPIRIPLIQ